jgi:phosphoribosylaminoimidazole-succinocarboxamide synthase
MLAKTNFTFPHQTNVYHGKVRDVYTVANELLVMVATDRISAFDHILPKPIAHKGAILNQLAVHFLTATADILPNWLHSSPHPNVSIGVACTPFKVEMVIRGYVTGHLWRTYKSGARELCGVALPDGLRENDKLPYPIITPTTKATEGHDEDISREEILAQGIVSAADYAQLESYTHALYERGTAMAAERGLLLVDTKYEFGKKNDTIYLIDEIHTPDSSRYFYADGYAARQAQGSPQRQLSKEFVREWLIAHHFQGKDGDVMPAMPDAFVAEITQRYTELYTQITNTEPQLSNYTTIEKDIENAVTAAIKAMPREGENIV